jgi:chloramphenicol-sensitive protein RarD
LFFHEPMPAMRWVGFALIWLALVLYTIELLRHRHRNPRVRPPEHVPARPLV